MVNFWRWLSDRHGRPRRMLTWMFEGTVIRLWACLHDIVQVRSSVLTELCQGLSHTRMGFQAFVLERYFTVQLYYSVVPRPTLPSLIGRKGSSPLRSRNCHRPIHVIMHVQPGAMKMVLWRHWMHVTHVHPVTSENQFRCTRLYVYWKERVTLILFVKVLAHGRHPFSNHDNKHTFCNDGLYFGHVSFLSGFFEFCRKSRPRLRLLGVHLRSPAKKKVIHVRGVFRIGFRDSGNPSKKKKKKTIAWRRAPRPAPARILKVM